MTKIDIVSGFLGAGKTTLIKKMLSEAYQGEKLVLIENEFGEISIDGGFLKDSGVQLSELSSRSPLGIVLPAGAAYSISWVCSPPTVRRNS